MEDVWAGLHFVRERFPEKGVGNSAGGTSAYTLPSLQAYLK